MRCRPHFHFEIHLHSPTCRRVIFTPVNQYKIISTVLTLKPQCQSPVELKWPTQRSDQINYTYISIIVKRRFYKLIYLHL